MTTVDTSVTVPRHLMDVHIDLTVWGVNMRFGNDTYVEGRTRYIGFLPRACDLDRYFTMLFLSPSLT